jgi:hypothetical protein
MKIITETFERTWWRLSQKALNVPDEDYHRNLWTYLMKIITETFERTWWRLTQKPFNVPDEDYHKNVVYVFIIFVNY